VWAGAAELGDAPEADVSLVMFHRARSARR
jgi:hypothetical protein